MHLSRLAGLLICLIVLAWRPAAAAESDLAGAWAWKVEGETIFIIRLDTDPGAGGSTEGPSSMNLTSAAGGVQLSELQKPVVHRTLQFIRATSAGALYRTVTDDPSQSSEYEVRREADGSAALVLVGSPLPPLPLQRVPSDVRVGPWDPARTYSYTPPSVQDNAELRALFDADQAARHVEDIDWTVVSAQDAERRAQVRRMLDRGEVRSGSDYRRAAFIFQHGGKPEDYLLAHALADAAVALGQVDAAWIAAATLDRYLQSIAKPQIYGTQFVRRNEDVGFSQGDLDRNLLPGAVRSAAGVPTLEAQEDQLRMMNEQAAATPSE